jgi:hypothetical protein
VYVEHFLVPTLCAGQIVVLDNLLVHHHRCGLAFSTLVHASNLTKGFVPFHIIMRCASKSSTNCFHRITVQL